MDISVSFKLAGQEKPLALRCMPQVPRLNDYVRLNSTTYVVCEVVWYLDDEDTTRASVKLVIP